MDYSVIVPVYNEEGSVKELYPKLRQVMDSLKRPYELIFINDGSSDKTLEVLKDFRKKGEYLTILDLRKNFGQSAAMKAGFDNASGKIIISMDGDMQNDPSDIPKLIGKIKEGYDVVSGWRHERKDPLSKKIPSKISNFLHRKATGVEIHDSGCSLKAYKKECLEGLELYGEMHRYIPAMIAEKGYKIGEVKVKHHPRVHGKSKYGVSRLFKGFLDLVDLEFWMHYAARPLHVFGGFGILFSAAGLIIALVLAILRMAHMISLSNSSLPLIAALLFLVGIQFLVFGILADIVIKLYYSNKEKKTYSVKEIIK